MHTAQHRYLHYFVILHCLGPTVHCFMYEVSLIWDYSSFILNSITYRWHILTAHRNQWAILAVCVQEMEAEHCRQKAWHTRGLESWEAARSFISVCNCNNVIAIKPPNCCSCINYSSRCCSLKLIKSSNVTADCEHITNCREPQLWQSVLVYFLEQSNFRMLSLK